MSVLLVAEQKLRRIGGGFEYSTTDGLGLTGYWIHRNLLRGGERLRVDAGSANQAADICGRLRVAGETCFVAS